jgi:hypothetical protein
MNDRTVKLKRRIVTADECKTELHDELPVLFQTFGHAMSMYEKEILLTPPEARARTFEASLLNSKMIQSVQQHFPGKWKFGKYKRFILRMNGYNIFFKKLDSKNRPMNIKTHYAVAIENQKQLNLFEESSADMFEPILFFGYKKDRFGDITDPRLVYIDESRIKWMITDTAVSKGEEILIGNLPKEAPFPVTPQIKAQRRKAANDQSII